MPLYTTVPLLPRGWPPPESNTNDVFRARRSVPKTTSGKIARAMCKKAHRSGALDADTVFLWGSDTTSNLSVGAGIPRRTPTTAEMDAQAERDEIPWSPPGGGSNGGGMEESKAEGGAKGNPAGMSVGVILEGVQAEVARILKATASAIPTVSCDSVWYGGGAVLGGMGFFA